MEEVRERLKENYGIELEGLFSVTKKGKVWFYKEEIGINAQRRGIYLGEFKPDGIRLNVYTASWLGRMAKKNIINISKEEFCKLLNGERVPYKTEPGYYVIKLGNDFVGSVRATGKELIPFFPKEFRSMVSCED